MIKFIKKKFTKFLETKRYLYFLPKPLRMKLFNIKKLKFYETKTGNYYLPKYAYKDIIRNSIINDTIFDDHIYQLSREYIKPNSIVLDLGSNFGQLGILFSKVQKNVDVYCFEASKYIYDILVKNVDNHSFFLSGCSSVSFDDDVVLLLRGGLSASSDFLNLLENS